MAMAEDEKRKRQAAYMREWRAKHPEYAAYLREWKANNKARAKMHNDKYYEAHRDEMELYRRVNRDKRNAQKAAWHAANPEKVYEYNKARKASKRQATPTWLTKEDRAAMRRLKSEAKALGHHVDHIVPLKGKTVSGLHVPWNLQVLPPHENIRKFNRITKE